MSILQMTLSFYQTILIFVSNEIVILQASIIKDIHTDLAGISSNSKKKT